MTAASKRLGRDSRRLLQMLASPGAKAMIRIDRVEIAGVASRQSSIGQTLVARYSMRKQAADSLLAMGLAVSVPEGALRALRLTPAGERLVARLRKVARPSGTDQTDVIDALRAQHDEITLRPVSVDGTERSVPVNHGESPLAALRRRSDKSGQPLIDAAGFAAGERLRLDYTRAALEPRMGIDWSNPLAGGGRGGAGLNATESMIAARQRFSAAMVAVGPELSGPLFDLCCFLKGLEQIERERGWPVRSAKVVMRLGLERLARHYGFDQEARGRNRAPLSHWMDEEHRARYPSA